jgi:methyl-accepting chemotaxis protein
MENLESSYRGFALTGKDSELDLYRASSLRIQQQTAAVRTLTMDNAGQQLRLSRLETVTAKKLAFGDAVIKLRQNQGLAAAAAAIQSGAGQQTMAEFRAITDEMKFEELRLLEPRTADATRRVGQTKTILIFGTLLGLLIAVAAGRSARRDSSARAMAEELFRDSE